MYHLADGTPVVLGLLIGRGGRAKVYGNAGNAKECVKIFEKHLRTNDRREKVEAEIEFLADIKCVAAPKALVFEDGEWCGFTQPFIEGESLDAVFKKDDCALSRRVDLMTAHAKAVAYLNRKNIVVGDDDFKNAVVDHRGRVTIVDADSFQFFYNGKLYTTKEAHVTSPEMLEYGLSNGAAFSLYSDGFLEGVNIHTAVFGVNPFYEKAVGDIPPRKVIADNIKACRWSYAQLDGHLPLDMCGSDLMSMFRMQFQEGIKFTASQWKKALERIQGIGFTTCQHCGWQTLSTGERCCNPDCGESLHADESSGYAGGFNAAFLRGLGALFAFAFAYAQFNCGSMVVPWLIGLCIAVFQFAVAEHLSSMLITTAASLLILFFICPITLT